MIVHHKKKVGELVLYGSSENILHFLITIIIGLAISMVFIVIALLWSVNLTYRQIMQADQAMYKAKNLNPHWFLYKPEI